MFFAWLVVLVVFGFVSGWQNIHPLFWWLLFVYSRPNEAYLITIQH